jgi:hypothetical protein
MDAVKPPAPETDEYGVTEYTLKCNQAGQICCKGMAQVESGGKVCEPGQNTPKQGFGARCGANQCRPEGHLWFSDCMSEANCASNRGTTDGGNEAGCVDGLKCCRMKKNRCHDEIKDPKKIYLCTGETECTSKGGTPKEKGAGCNVSGSYPQCCEFIDDLESPMPSAGEPLIGLGGSGVGSGRAAPGNRIPRKYRDINAFCFTELECAKESAPENWVKGQGCANKGNTPQGFCKAPAPEYQLQYPLAGVTTISGLKNFIGLIFNYGMGLLLIVSAMFFVYGGLRYLFSAVANDVQVAKTVMTDSLAGLVLGLAAYAILANVNFNTINLRSFDVYMINKLSFYDTIYCKDMKPSAGSAEMKFQDAGTPFAPLNLDITKGYTLSAKQTLCGKEYFIDGGDSLSVCTGSGCGNEGAEKGLCLNCASNPVNCRTSSEKEHACFDSHIGGNIIMAGYERATLDAGNRKMQAFVFCVNGTERTFSQVGDFDIKDKVVSKGIVSGLVSSYAIKFDMGKIKEFKNTCKGKSGLILEHHITTGLNGWWYYYVTKSCKFDYNSSELFNFTIASYVTIGGAFDAMSEDIRQGIFSDAWTLDEALNADGKPILCNVSMAIPKSFTEAVNRHQ